MWSYSLAGVSSVPRSVPSVDTVARRVKCAVSTATRPVSACSTVRRRLTSTCQVPQRRSAVTAERATPTVSSALVVLNALTARRVVITRSTQPRCWNTADWTFYIAITLPATRRSASSSFIGWFIVSGFSVSLYACMYVYLSAIVQR